MRMARDYGEYMENLLSRMRIDAAWLDFLGKRGIYHVVCSISLSFGHSSGFHYGDNAQNGEKSRKTVVKRE